MGRTNPHCFAPPFVREQQGHDPKLYGDFRELLADPGIDAVALAAIQSGQEVVWDPVAYRYTHSAAFNATMSKPIRGAWLPTG